MPPPLRAGNNHVRVKKRVQSDRRRAASCAPDSPMQEPRGKVAMASLTLVVPDINGPDQLSPGVGVSGLRQAAPAVKQEHRRESVTMATWMSNGFQGMPIFQTHSGNQTEHQIDSPGSIHPGISGWSSHPDSINDETAGDPGPVLSPAHSPSSISEPNIPEHIGQDDEGEDSVEVPRRTRVVCQTLGSKRPSLNTEIFELPAEKEHAISNNSIRRGSRAADADQEELLLKAITEATERTRRRAEQEMQAALNKQAEFHEQQQQQAVRKAIDDTLASIQGRLKDEGSPQDPRRQLKLEKQRSKQLEEQAKRLTTQIERHKKAAAEANERGKLAQSNEKEAKKSEMSARQAELQAKEQLQRIELELMAAKKKLQESKQDQLEGKSVTMQDHAQLEQAKRRLSELEAGHREMVDVKVSELEAALKSKSTSLTTAQTELQEAKQEIRRKEQELQEHQAQVKSLELQITQLDKVNWDMDRELAAMTQHAKELDGKLKTTQVELDAVSEKCNQSIKKLQELQKSAERVNEDTLKLLEDAAATEKERRKEVEQDAKKVEKELITEVTEVRQLAQTQARKSMIADFAHNSVHKQLSAVKKELASVRAQLAKIQKQAAEALEREKTKVSKLTRELASTRKMLQASKQGHKKAPPPNKHLGTSPLDVIQHARERVFGRPHEIVTKKGKTDDSDDLWIDDQDPFSLELDEEPGIPSPETWDHETSINEAISSELSRDHSAGVTLPLI